MDYKAQEKRIVISKLLKYLSHRPELSRVDFLQHINVFMRNIYEANKGREFIIASKCYEAIDNTFTKEEIEEYLQVVENPVFRKLMNKIPQFVNEFENNMGILRRTA